MKSNKSDISIPQFVKQQRQKLKLTQSELALRTGLGLRLIRDLEQNRRPSIGLDNINRVLKVFGCELRPVAIGASNE